MKKQRPRIKKREYSTKNRIEAVLVGPHNVLLRNIAILNDLQTEYKQETQQA